jgi:hypothetical protein
MTTGTWVASKLKRRRTIRGKDISKIGDRIIKNQKKSPSRVVTQGSAHRERPPGT